MDIVTIASRKGGVAKTTTLIQWGVVEAIENGKRVMLVDMDKQGSLTQWWNARLSDDALSESGDLHCAHVPHTDLAEFCDWAEDQGADLVLIDTRPDVQDLARAAIEVADLVVTPCGTMIFDAAAIGETLELASELETPACILITRAHPSSKLKREIRQVLEQYGVPLCPRAQREFVLVQRALSHGMSTVEYDPKHKSSADARTSWAWVSEQLEEIQ